MAISAGAVTVAAVHVAWPSLGIDAITSVLLLVAVVPWLQPLFKSLELPGGLKLEFQEVEVVAKQAGNAGLLSSPSTKQAPYSFQVVASSDPTLALAGLRIELERSLDALARTRQQHGSWRGITDLLDFLNSAELINSAEKSALAELTKVLNRVVHGADVSPGTAESALDLGARILSALQTRVATGVVEYRGIADPTATRAPAEES